MLDCLGDEVTARVTRKRLSIDPGFVWHIEQEENLEVQAVDDGRDDGVAKT